MLEKLKTGEQQDGLKKYLISEYWVDIHIGWHKEDFECSCCREKPEYIIGENYFGIKQYDHSKIPLDERPSCIHLFNVRHSAIYNHMVNNFQEDYFEPYCFECLCEKNILNPPDLFYDNLWDFEKKEFDEYKKSIQI